MLYTYQKLEKQGTAKAGEDFKREAIPIHFSYVTVVQMPKVHMNSYIRKLIPLILATSSIYPIKPYEIGILGTRE